MNATSPPKFGVGTSPRRKEDASLIIGAGQFTDDEKRENECHGFVLRSPYAHATFSIGDLSDARAVPGVLLVLIHADVKEYGALPCVTLLPQVDGSPTIARDIPLLCEETVRHVGDGVVFIVAETLAQAREASELIEIDYEMLQACVDTEASLGDDAPLVYPEAKTNLAFEYGRGNQEKTDLIFTAADKIVELKIINNRLVCNYMEPRACMAEWSAEDERYTLTTGSQGVHGMRNLLAKIILKVDPAKVRVITKDVGGGFGTKTFIYREYPLSMIAAKLLARPVRWVSDRSEHFVADAHGRDNVTTIRNGA